MFAECPAKWKYRYVDRVPSKPKHFFSFGNSIHKPLEFMYSGDKCPSLKAVLKSYQDNWLSAGYKDAKSQADAKVEGEKIITTFYKRHAKSWRKPLFVELKFDFTVGHVRVTGFIDRLDTDKKGGLHVIDYKTGRALDAGRAPGDPQLTLYQMAVESLGMGKVVALTLYHVPSLKAHSSKRHGDTLVAALTAKILDTAKKINAEEFGPTPSENACRWCDYKNLCPVWRE